VIRVEQEPTACAQKRSPDQRRQQVGEIQADIMNQLHGCILAKSGLPEAKSEKLTSG